MRAKIQAGMIAMAGLVVLAAGLFLAPAAAAKPVERKGAIRQLYNTRYCEFLMVEQVVPEIKADVFNTVGVDDCSPAAFAAATPDAGENGYLLAAKSGPSRWTIDCLFPAPSSEPVELGGLMTRNIGTLTPPSAVPPPYVEIPFSTRTAWSYRRGRTLRLLISPNGRRYAMQSYSRAAGSTLREKDLNRLGKNAAMELPAGWRYKTRKVKRKTLTLRPRGSAAILRDTLGNVYQRFRWTKPKNR
jgi:hypothetical protein